MCLTASATFSLERTRGQFKNFYELLNLHFSTNYTSFNVWARYFAWNFKGYLWNSTQNSLPIHWKIWILHDVVNIRAPRFTSSYPFSKCSQMSQTDACGICSHVIKYKPITVLHLYSLSKILNWFCGPYLKYSFIHPCNTKYVPHSIEMQRYTTYRNISRYSSQNTYPDMEIWIKIGSVGNSHQSAGPRPETLEDWDLFDFSSILCLWFEIQAIRTYNFFDLSFKHWR